MKTADRSVRWPTLRYDEADFLGRGVALGQTRLPVESPVKKQRFAAIRNNEGKLSGFRPRRLPREGWRASGANVCKPNAAPMGLAAEVALSAAIPAIVRWALAGLLHFCQSLDGYPGQS